MFGTLRYIARKVFRTMPELLSTGTPAPDFSVVDHQGRTVSRKELEGKRYVLWFYPKSDTPG